MVKTRHLPPGKSGVYKWKQCPHCKARFEVERDLKRGRGMGGTPMLSTYTRHVAHCPEAKS